MPQLIERWLAGDRRGAEPFLSHTPTLDEVNRGFELMEAQDGIRSVIRCLMRYRRGDVSRKEEPCACQAPSRRFDAMGRERGPPPKLDRRAALLGAAGARPLRRCPVELCREAADEPPAGSRPTFREGFPGFLGAPSVLDRQVTVTIPANGFYGQTWTFWEHNCTHLDVPAHFITGGRFSPRSLDELVRPLVVVDISARATANADAEVLVSDVVHFEHGNGGSRGVRSSR